MPGRHSLLPALLVLAACSPEVTDEPSVSTALNCSGKISANARFFGPENLELTVDGELHRLQRARSASGARYVGPEIEFWNKGAESMLRIGESAYTCTTADG